MLDSIKYFHDITLHSIKTRGILIVTVMHCPFLAALLLDMVRIWQA